MSFANIEYYKNHDQQIQFSMMQYKTIPTFSCMQEYRFKSDREDKVRVLAVEESRMTASEFCTLLCEETFKGRKATCMFVPVNYEPRAYLNGLVVVDQVYAQKFEPKKTLEPGEIPEENARKNCDRSRPPPPPWRPRYRRKRWNSKDRLPRSKRRFRFKRRRYERM